MDKRLLVLGCSSKKLVEYSSTPVLVMNLYSGPRFGLVRNWLLREATESQLAKLDVFVLSGKYGLVSVWDTVLPYNLKVNKHVVEWLRPVVSDQVEVFLGDTRYCEIGLSMGPLYRSLAVPSLERAFGGVPIVSFFREGDSNGLKTMREWLRAL